MQKTRKIYVKKRNVEISFRKFAYFIFHKTVNISLFKIILAVVHSKYI